MPAFTIADLTPELMLEYVARGHGFAKHVLGGDESRDTKGLNVFRENYTHSGQFLGPDLGIQTPQDLQKYLLDMMSDPDTQAFRSPDTGRIIMYNSRDNVFTEVNPFSSNGDDFGTAYRYPESAARFEAERNAARDMSGAPQNRTTFREFDNSTDAGSVRQAVQGLVSDMQAHPRVYTGRRNNGFETILEERPGVAFAGGHPQLPNLQNGFSDSFRDTDGSRAAANAELLSRRQQVQSLVPAIKENPGFVADLDRRGRPDQMFFLDEQNGRVIEVNGTNVIEHTFENLPAEQRALYAQTFFEAKLAEAAPRFNGAEIKIKAGYDQVVDEYRRVGNPPRLGTGDQLEGRLNSGGELSAATAYADEAVATMALMGFTDPQQLEVFEALPSGASFDDIADDATRRAMQEMAEAKELLSIADQNDGDLISKELARFRQNFDTLKTSGNLDLARQAIRNADLAGDAADVTRGAIEAIRALRIGARAAKVTKMGVITTVAGTTAAVALTSAAHAQQRELAADILKQEFPYDQYPEGSPEYEQMRERYETALEEYRDLNIDVERLMNADAVGNQFLITIPFGIAATEKYAQSTFEAFSNRWNLSEQAHQALGMSMFDGRSLRGEFALQVGDAIPDTMGELPASLHALWAAKQEMDRAQNIYDLRSRNHRMHRPQREAWQARKEAAAEDLREAEAEYQKEFEAVFSDPQAAAELLSRLDPEMIFEMVETTARFNFEDAPPIIKRMGELQNEIADIEERLEKLNDSFTADEFSGVDGSYEAFREERQALRERLSAARDELEGVEDQVKDSPEEMYEYIRGVFGGATEPQGLTSEFTQNAGNPVIQATAAAFAALSVEDQNDIIDEVARLSRGSEELRASHPYLRELAVLDARAERLPSADGSRYYNKHRHRIERERSEIEERRAVIEEELRAHPEILAAAADENPTVKAVIDQEVAEQSASNNEAALSVSGERLDTYDGDPDLIDEATAAGLNIDESLVAPGAIPAGTFDSTVTFEAVQP